MDFKGPSAGREALRGVGNDKASLRTDQSREERRNPSDLIRGIFFDYP